MIIAIIGSGGREHSICKKISESPRVKKIFCIPGNAGTDEIAENIEINLSDFEEIKNFLKKIKADIVIVGPEKPLVDGIVDYLEKEKIKVFGPKKIPSQFEGSKIFTKKICKKYNIPTANFGIFSSIHESLFFLKSANFPLVVKADGLAGGKGVYICEVFSEAEIAINEIFKGKFGKAENILIEEFLEGDEMSYFIITDGYNFKKFQTAQDHKRVFEKDKGKNTGGMGAYAPSGLINSDMDKKIIERIINPTLKAIRDMGETYKGFLYAGLMIKKNEPYLIEYNVRMGDPECQTILPLLDGDLLDIIEYCCLEKLDKIEVKWKKQKSLCVVLCSKGYPDQYKNNEKIENLKKLKNKDKIYIFHAGTKKINNEIFSNGGRVLNFVSVSSSYKHGREKILKLIDNLGWPNGHYRKDIGYKVIDQ